MEKNTDSQPPFLVGLQFAKYDFQRSNSFPFYLPWLENFELSFSTPVTFFVGENGSGKSTLMEAIAALGRLPVGGGSGQELANSFGPEKESPLIWKTPPIIKLPKASWIIRKCIGDILCPNAISRHNVFLWQTGGLNPMAEPHGCSLTVSWLVTNRFLFLFL